MSSDEHMKFPYKMKTLNETLKNIWGLEYIKIIFSKEQFTQDKSKTPFQIQRGVDQSIWP